MRPAGLGVTATRCCGSLGVAALAWSAPLHMGTPPLLGGLKATSGLGLGATLRGEKRPTLRLLTLAWLGSGLGLGLGLGRGRGLGQGSGRG